MRDFDIAVVGAGAAGLTLAHRLTELCLPTGTPPRVALLEPPPGPARSNPRTWCFWEHGSGRWDGILTARWEHLSVVPPRGSSHDAAISPLSYKMLSSQDFEAYVRARLGEHVEPLTATVTSIADGRDRARILAEHGDGDRLTLTARWVFDTRPAPRLPAAQTTMLQHFRGWFLRTPENTFDASRALLMDLRTPQPRQGVSFAYVLPLSNREALIEYTEFTRETLNDAGYNAALHHYTNDVLGLGAFSTDRVEQGVIPMTDARMPTRVGARVFRLGASAGATRPSSGYTFSGIQRQVDSVLQALREPRVPVPALPHRRRHLAMDAVLLRALDTGRLDGADFFTRLFTRNRIRDVLDFLDGHTSLARELAMGTTTPLVPMTRTTAERALMALRGPRH